MIFLFFSLIFASRIAIPFPVGPISKQLDYQIDNMRLSLPNPGIGLTNVSWFRVLDKLPKDFPVNLISCLSHHLRSIEIKSNIKGEVLIVIGRSRCGLEVRVVPLTDGNLSHLIPVITPVSLPKCCAKSKRRIIYLVTHGVTYNNWNRDRSMCKNDPPLDLRGIKQVEEMVDKLKSLNINKVISGTSDASVITGEIIAQKLGIPLMLNDILSDKCGVQYQSWRLLDQGPSYVDLKLNELSNAVLLMDSCTASNFVKSIGYQDDMNPGSILEI